MKRRGEFNKDMEKLEPPYIASKDEKLPSFCGSSLVAPGNMKHKVTACTNNITSMV